MDQSKFWRVTLFNSIGEPRRREIICLLSDGQEWAVSDVVARVSIAQPAVSKHLGVLRKVGVVTVVKRGQRRLYRLHPPQRKPVHDWVKSYERYWTPQLSRIKQRGFVDKNPGSAPRTLETQFQPKLNLS
jgi:DNA-binding transcriptional ArsR family regulator